MWHQCSVSGVRLQNINDIIDCSPLEWSSMAKCQRADTVFQPSIKAIWIKCQPYFPRTTNLDAFWDSAFLQTQLMHEFANSKRRVPKMELGLSIVWLLLVTCNILWKWFCACAMMRVAQKQWLMHTRTHHVNVLLEAPTPFKNGDFPL